MSALAGQTALVTGAARGIGRAVACKLARAGCDVAITYYNSHEEAAALSDEVRAVGRRALVVQTDVSNADSVAELAAAVRREFAAVDLVVSNAASGVLRPVREMTRKHWRWCLEINAFALALLAQQIGPLMTRGGRIVALTSLGAQRALPGYGFVGASKAALESLVRSLALELAPQGVCVNAVSAGPVDTDALRAMPERDAILAGFAARAPAGAMLTPEAVADAVYLLCLPEAAMITGHTLVVDGGYSVVA